MARHIVIRTLASILVAASRAGAAARSWLTDLGSPADILAVVRSRQVLGPWMTQSFKLLLGTLAYNVFVLVFVQPMLRRWFPPLKPWEHVTGLFSGGRTTYEELVPAVATTLWILGNALLFALMNRDLRRTQAAIAAGGTMTRLESRPRAAR